ncbi:hypothetical protein RB195_018754 [Necator americanus]
MDKRFAVTPMEAMMLPDHYQLPVECESEASALDAFVNCTNRMICSCENMKAPQTCQCPHDSLQNLRKEVLNVMPIRTPFTEIFSDSKEIYALSKQGEITLAIESNLLIGGTEFIINQPCEILVRGVKGCYSCSEGARIDFLCKSSINSWVTVQCENHVFPIECGPTNTSVQVILDFEYSVVSQVCHTSCDGKNVIFDLQETLLYHPRSKRNLFSQTEVQELDAKNSLLNFDLPDLNPLMNTTKMH